MEVLDLLDIAFARVYRLHANEDDRARRARLAEALAALQSAYDRIAGASA